MGSGTDFINGLAAGTDIPRGTVATVYRMLREDGRGLGVKATRGGGSRKNPPGPYHAVNMVLAQIAALPMHAADAVIALRGLRPEQVAETRYNAGNGIFMHAGRNIAGPAEAMGDGTLGEVLDRLVTNLARATPEERAAVEKEGEAKMWSLTLCLDPLTAWISYGCDDGVRRTARYVPPQATLDAALAAPPRVKILRQVMLPMSLLVLAAELVADAVAPADLLSTKGHTLPARENAALPGAASHENQPPHTELPATTDNPEARPARSIFQPGSQIGAAGHSPSTMDEDDPPDEIHPYSASAAAA